MSDTRPALRRHFETDAVHVVITTLWGLSLQGEAKADIVTEAARHYGVDPDLPDPFRRLIPAGAWTQCR